MSTVEIVLPALHPKQAEVKDGLTRFNVLCCGRRWGKNVFAHEYIVDGLLEGMPVGWGSPTYKNLTEDWRTLTELLAPVTTRISEQERRIECVNGSVLEMWSLDHADPIRGRKYGRFVLNEAAYVPYLVDTWNKILRPTLIDLKGDALFCSTPNGLNGFHVVYSWGTGGAADWKSWHFTSYDNPHIDPAEIDGHRATATEAEFKQEYLAEFVQSTGAVFRNLEAALTAPQQEPAEHKDHTIVGGVDWGKSNDFTALSLVCVDCGREIAIDRFNEIDYMFQVDRLETMHKRWGVKRWRVELNSIGAPLFEQLQRRSLPVVGFQTTATSKRPLIEGLALAIERGDITLLPDEAGRAELQAYTSRETETGHRVYSAPDGMHDDTVIARALAYMQMRETPAETPERKQRRERQDEAMRLVRKVF